jgi:hypothetical protein
MTGVYVFFAGLAIAWLENAHTAAKPIANFDNLYFMSFS